MQLTSVFLYFVATTAIASANDKDAASVFKSILAKWGSGSDFMDEVADDIVITNGPIDAYLPDPDGLVGVFEGKDAYTKWLKLLATEFQFESFGCTFRSQVPDGTTAVFNCKMIIRNGQFLRSLDQDQIVTVNAAGQLTRSNLMISNVKYLNAAAYFRYAHENWAVGNTAACANTFADDAVISWPESLGTAWPQSVTGIFTGRYEVNTFLTKVANVDVKWLKLDNEILSSTDKEAIVIETGVYEYNGGKYNLQFQQRFTINDDHKFSDMSFAVMSHSVAN